jgi:hypothetical protein
MSSANTLPGKPKAKRSAPTASRSGAIDSKVLNMNNTLRPREALAARDDGDVVARPGERMREGAPDGAGTDDRDSHAPALRPGELPRNAHRRQFDLQKR